MHHAVVSADVKHAGASRGARAEARVAGVGIRTVGLAHQDRFAGMIGPRGCSRRRKLVDSLAAVAAQVGEHHCAPLPACRDWS